MNAVVQHFDRYSTSGGWSGLYAKVDGVTYHFHFRRLRVLELLPERLGRVLDVGCGPGVMVKAVLDRGGTFLGIDVSPAMVDEGNKRFAGVPDVGFRLGNIENLELPSGAFDQVICMGVIEYLASSRRAFEEIARVLKPGGRAVVTIPKRYSFDHLATVLTAPLRLLGRALGFSDSDHLPRLQLQPDELDLSAKQAGLDRSGWAHYSFRIIPYPFTRFLPHLCMRANAPFERFHATSSDLVSFFSRGYVGSYVKR